MRLGICVLLIIMNLFLGGGLKSEAAEKNIVVFNIEGEIDPSSVAVLKKAYDKAEQLQASLIIMQMDTFGGRVDSATQMRDIIIASKIPTVCLIKNRAWSAGALIALAHNKIAMTSSASIGAAEPIPNTEKNISALKAEFASTAKHSKRNEAIAEAMVDKSLGYGNYAKPGQILSLTQEQALREKFADFGADDIDAVVKELKIEQGNKVIVEKTYRESLIGFFDNPAVKSILITVIILGLITEIKTAGTGIAGLMAIIAGIAVFGSSIVTTSGGMLPALVFLAGVALLILEVFIPGFGISGMLGIVFLMGSFFLVLGGGTEAVRWLLLSLGLAVAGVYVLSKYITSTSIYNRLILKEGNADLGVTKKNVNENLLRQVGVTITQMRPTGKIKIEEKQYDALTSGEFLEVGESIVIVKIQGGQIYVEKQ